MVVRPLLCKTRSFIEEHSKPHARNFRAEDTPGYGAFFADNAGRKGPYEAKASAGIRRFARSALRRSGSDDTMACRPAAQYGC